MIVIDVPLLPVYVNKANAGNTKKAIFNFNQNKAFENLSIDTKIGLLNEILLISLEIIFQIKKLSMIIVRPHE